MTPEMIAALFAGVFGLGTCCVAFFGPLGVLIGILGKNWIDARNAEDISQRADIELNAKVKQSEVELLRQQIIDSNEQHKKGVEQTSERHAKEIERLVARHNQDIDVIRERCAKDRIADQAEIDQWKIEANQALGDVRVLVEKLNGERRENARIRAMAYAAGYEIPDERRASDFTKPGDAAQQAELLEGPK